MDGPHQSPLRAALREFYDKSSEDREASETAGWKIRERESFLSLLQHEQKHTLLEVGAGVGRDAKFFQDQGLQVVCTDLSSQMVALCRQKRLDARVMDMSRLQFPRASFSAVYSLNSLLHLPKTEFPSVLREIERVLTPGGLFFLGVYGGYDHAGIREDDYLEPKRFFSFFSDDHIQAESVKVFDLLDFHSIDYRPGSSLHFQSLTLRKR